jgi:co-chaperonin GroES (HSP10)
MNKTRQLEHFVPHADYMLVRKHELPTEYGNVIKTPLSENTSRTGTVLKVGDGSTFYTSAGVQVNVPVPFIEGDVVHFGAYCNTNTNLYNENGKIEEFLVLKPSDIYGREESSEPSVLQ